MAKNSAVWIDQLVSLLGLDTETVRTQILPFLDSHDDELSLRTHLEGLVGTDTPLSKNFIRDFTRSRFPRQVNTSSASGSTTPTRTTSAVHRSSTNVAGATKKRGTKTLSERAGNGKQLQARRIQGGEGDENEEERLAKLAEAFGGMGTVYRKKTGEDDFFAGTKGKKGKQPGSRTPTSLEPQPIPVPAFQPEKMAAVVNPQAIASPHHALVEHEESRPPPPPTSEMLAIDTVLTELTSTTPFTSSACSSTALNRKMCFCHGHTHALAPYAPLCYSCGLVLCVAIHPSPLSPLSACPSCSASPLLGAAARSDLVAKLSAERDILFEQQLLQIQLEREQKKLIKASNKSAREEEAALFPELGMNPSKGASGNGSAATLGHGGPVMGKHGALQKAKAIAGEAGRTAKVLSLDMKTHKVKQHTKVSRPKPVAVKQENVEVDKVEKEEVSDPFVGVDGSRLVRDEFDDGMRANGAVTGKNVKGRDWDKEGEKIPSRSWTFQGRQWGLRPTQPVQ
ncbi:uncharacterized protein MEPE_04131 [Melanopsichium pennsylvanicum]|uniref:TRIP4/RQT4 C2HC5-type zinc finger domain-containing protein n=2 Tax=Melanopsichium pennsylvanicum TaxID=63383 RepID=A0AAJ4XPB7_9BASI|nr:zinc c2hc5-type protein [Melanopsichium pennsylvanicum 4]SNX85422.1 uncharacterized protein MEPE_04131 [Melanopsichium pennsylvanicum]